MRRRDGSWPTGWHTRGISVERTRLTHDLPRALRPGHTQLCRLDEEVEDVRLHRRDAVMVGIRTVLEPFPQQGSRVREQCGAVRLPALDVHAQSLDVVDEDGVRLGGVDHVEEHRLQEHGVAQGRLLMVLAKPFAQVP